jgi:hypothetical protein
MIIGSQVKKYYVIGGMTIAMNDGTGLKYLLTDHRDLYLAFFQLEAFNTNGFSDQVFTTVSSCP